MKFLLLLAVLLSFASPALAQIAAGGEEGEITDAPICTFLVNRSDQVIMGTVFTAPQRLPGGDAVRHRENFRLDPAGRQQICAAGPFYAGRRLEIVIRTIIPLFNCRTTLDQEIFLDAVEGEAGFKKLSATCY